MTYEPIDDWNLMTQPTTLYTLQQHELAVDQARARLDDIEHILSNDEQVKQSQATLDKQQTLFNQVQATVKDLELEIASLTQKIADVDELLYSGKLKNPKELADRQDELASLQRRLGIKEEDLVLALKDSEEQKTALGNARQNLEETQAEQKQRNVDLVAEQKQLNKDIKKNLRARKSLVAEIPEKDYKYYRQLRKKHKGQPIAVIEHEEICSFCHVGQTTSAIQDIKRNDEYIYCGNCGRILVSV